VYIGNSGNAPLIVSAISVASPEFWVGRSSLVVPPGATDTVGVYYRPTAGGSDVAAIKIVSNAFDSLHVTVATAQGIVSLDTPRETPGPSGLAQNRPNPFTSATWISYTLPHAADVELEIFDLHGHRVAILANDHESAGRHEVRFGAGARAASGAALGKLPVGVYFCRLRAAALTATRKMLLLE